ncbi:MAG: hypothetical protein ACK4WD_11760 [Flavobacteriales bacterium]|jgi:hypothetical protein
MEKVQKILSSKIGILVAYTILAFLLFPQIGLFQNPLKWDAIDCFLPWRINVSDAINAGEWPWWSAYQHLGFPLHADPDTGAIYPIVWIISLIYGYDLYALNFEFCFHIFLAGFGMHRLVRFHGYSNTVAWCCGIAFMSNGIFMSNAQNYAFLIGMVWFPWVYQALIQSLKLPSFRNASELAFTSFMFLAGSYPGVVIIGVYVLLGVAVFFFIKKIFIEKQQDIVKKLRQFILVCALPTAAVCAFPVVASFETYNEITRTAGLNEKRITENPFPPKAYISLLTPYAVGTRDGVEWGSDFSMINFFMGLTFLLGFTSWIFRKEKKRREWFYLSIAVFLMVAALGAYSPLRMWLAHLPAMGLFRHPSIFRFIAVTFFILVAANGMSYFFMLMHKKRRLFIFLTAIPFIALLLINIRFIDATVFPKVWEEFQSKDGTPKLSVEGRVVVQSIFFIIVLLYLFIQSNARNMIIGVMLITAFSIQLNIYSTMVNNHLLARENSKLHQLLETRTAYAGERLASYHSDSLAFDIPFIWRNEGIYIAKPAWDGYNSFIFSRYNVLEESGRLLEFKEKSLIFSACGDSCLMNEWRLETNEISVSVELPKSDSLVLLQTWVPMWRAFVDGKPVTIDIYKGSFPVVALEKGQHTVKFEYHPTKTIYAGYLSVGSFLILLLLSARFRKD